MITDIFRISWKANQAHISLVLLLSGGIYTAWNEQKFNLFLLWHLIQKLDSRPTRILNHCISQIETSVLFLQLHTCWLWPHRQWGPALSKCLSCGLNTWNRIHVSVKLSGFWGALPHAGLEVSFLGSFLNALQVVSKKLLAYGVKGLKHSTKLWKALPICCLSVVADWYRVTHSVQEIWVEPLEPGCGNCEGKARSAVSVSRHSSSGVSGEVESCWVGSVIPCLYSAQVTSISS